MKDLLKHFKENKQHHIDELCQFLRIPSVSTQSVHRADVKRAAAWVHDQLRNADLDCKIVPTDGHPIVFGTSTHVPGAPTVLIYGHYDVQPAEPLELWTTPAFEPTIRDGKVFARGAADDKGQVFIYLKVLEAYQKVRGKLPFNVKVLIEGEEEIGSANLVPFLRAQKKELACDALLVSDTHMFGLNQPSITVAMRGIVAMEVTVETAKGDLHSGGFGGAVANPLQVLAEILTTCKHPKTGKITIPGFYDDVRRLTARERAALKQIKNVNHHIKKEARAHALFGERGMGVLEQIGARPTFEINGLWGGYTGEGFKTVLPAQAHAKLSMRLVADQSPAKIANCVAKHLKAQAPAHAKLTIRHDKNRGAPVRTNTESLLYKKAEAAVKEVFGKEPIPLPEGGSIPILADFKKALKVEPILLGFGLPDDNLHAPNEKFDLRMLERGMKTVASFFEHL